MHRYKQSIPGLMQASGGYMGRSIEAEGRAPRLQSDPAGDPSRGEPTSRRGRCSCLGRARCEARLQRPITSLTSGEQILQTGNPCPGAPNCCCCVSHKLACEQGHLCNFYLPQCLLACFIPAWIPALNSHSLVLNVSCTQPKSLRWQQLFPASYADCDIKERRWLWLAILCEKVNHPTNA